MVESDAARIWVYLSASPLVGMTMTLVAYIIAYRLYIYTKYNPILNPLVTAIALLIVFLLVTNTSYEAYFEGGQFIHFLLGPATVALSIPLYKQISEKKCRNGGQNEPTNN